MGKKGKKKPQSQGEQPAAAKEEQQSGPSREASQPPEDQSKTGGKGKKKPQSQGEQPAAGKGEQQSGSSREASQPPEDQPKKGGKGKKKAQSQGEQSAAAAGEPHSGSSREASQPLEDQSKTGGKGQQPVPSSQGTQPGPSKAGGPQGDQPRKGKKGPPQAQPSHGQQDDGRGPRHDQPLQQQKDVQAVQQGFGRGQPTQQQREQGPRGQQRGGQPGQQQQQHQQHQQQQQQQHQQQRGQAWAGQQVGGPPPQQSWRPQQAPPPGDQRQQHPGPPPHQQVGVPTQGYLAGAPGQQQGFGAQGPPQAFPPGFQTGQGPPSQQSARGPPSQIAPGRGQQRQQQPIAGAPGYQQGFGAQGPPQAPSLQPGQGPPSQQSARGPPSQTAAGRGQQRQQQPTASAPGYQQGAQSPPPQGPSPSQQAARGPPQQRAAGKGQQPQQASTPGQMPSTSPMSSVRSVTSSLADVQITRIDKGDEGIVSKTIRKPGTKGRKIPVESNHLQLNLGSLKTAYHYDVKIEPDKPKKYMRPVVASFIRKLFPTRSPAFDGKKNLYTASPLTQNLNDFFEDEVSLREEDGREKLFRVEIKFANQVDLTALRNFLNQPATPQEAIQVVDIVLRMAPVQSCYPVGRSFFVKPDRIIDLGQGMEMYHGFYQSAIRGWKPLLNVDVAHKAFPKDINVVDALVDLLNTGRQEFRREDLRNLYPDQEDILYSFIKTLRVNYQIPGHPESKKGYRVNGTGECAQKAIFTHENKQITIVEYFQRFKNYKIRYPMLPTLWVGNPQRPDKILLPLELCVICEGQALNRKMTDLQTSKMIRHAATDTTTRKNKIMQGIDRANYNNNPCVREFGFSVGNEFQKLDARVLAPPELQYANKTVRVFKGVWRNDSFLSAVTINKWTVVNACKYPPRPDDYRKMIDLFERSARDCGMTFTSRAVEPFKNIPGRQNYSDIEQYFKSEKGKFDVIFVVVPESGPQYSYVKKAAEISVGCLTQCIKSNTVGRKMNPQTAVNILLKVNSKLNGINHTFSPQSKPNILKRPVMIMGADVTHPGPDARDIPSVAAVTASHDPKAFQYNICWRLQNPKVEIIEDLQAIVLEHLKFFYSKTKAKPEAIVFFRDGVSEGQFDQVKNEEINAIRKACKAVQKDGYEPKITFLVVQKRHHTRLFPMNPRDSEDRNMNVPAGTCVDTEITHPFLQDFYLVSHASIQGVAKPTKYCTLWDDNNMDNDQIEELAYYLCHMFSRCNRSVSYPAPTYYAHLAAARAKVYIENDRLNMSKLQQEFDKFQIKDEIRKGLPMFFV